MKPNFELISDKHVDVLGRSNRFPITDCNYQSIGLGEFNGHCGKVSPSFHNISRDYFNNEARQSFAAEAAFFGAMIVTTVWPMIYGVYAIAHMLRVTLAI